MLASCERSLNCEIGFTVTVIAVLKPVTKSQKLQIFYLNIAVNSDRASITAFQVRTIVDPSIRTAVIFSSGNRIACDKKQRLEVYRTEIVLKYNSINLSNHLLSNVPI